MTGERLRAVFGIAATRLRHDRTRTVLAVLGVTLAVLSTTLLGSLGVGVIDTGQQKFDAADRDLWISGGPTRIAPGTLGGFEGGIVDAHSVSENLSERNTINNAAPLLFQTVYLGPNKSSLDTIVAVGITSSGALDLSSGDGFGSDAAFYNDGAYNGTQNERLVIGTRVESRFDVGVNDSVHVGGTVVDARRTTYTVSGTSSTFSQFLGTQTVALPLAELQAMTGKASTDQASIISIDVADDADVTVVAERLRAEYPEYTVRTNAEQLEAIIANRVVVVASGVVLAGLAVLSGIALTVNLLVLLVIQEQQSLAAIRAIGVSRGVVIGTVVVQGVCYGILGAALGLLLTVPASVVLNGLAASLVGFEGLVQLTVPVLVAGAGIALVAGFVSALVAGWRAADIAPLETLER